MDTKAMGPVEKIGEIELWVEPQSGQLLPMVQEWPPNPNLKKMVVTAVMISSSLQRVQGDDGYTWGGRSPVGVEAVRSERSSRPDVRLVTIVTLVVAAVGGLLTGWILLK